MQTVLEQAELISRVGRQLETDTRNFFDQYGEPENRLSHALVAAEQ